MELPVTLENLFGQNGTRVNCSVGDYLKQIIERLEALGKYASASKHRVLCSHLSRFRSLNIRFDEIDHTFLRDFELFLRKNGNASNSIATKFAIFKAAYNKALADGIFIQKVNPFAKYKVGSLWTRTRKRAITKGDIQKLMALEIEPSHKTEYTLFAKDIFLFSYFTAGINFTDMATLRYGDIVDGRIYYSRHKTQKLLSFQLVPNALQIVQKYSKAGHAKEDYIFPILNRNVHRTPQQISIGHTRFWQNQSGIKGAGKTDWIGGPIDDLRCPPHIRNRPETVRSKRGTDFRIVGTLRPLDHANLPRFIRERANRRSHAASAVRIGRSAALLETDLLSSKDMWCLHYPRYFPTCHRSLVPAKHPLPSGVHDLFHLLLRQASQLLFHLAAEQHGVLRMVKLLNQEGNQIFFARNAFGNRSEAASYHLTLR